MINTRNGRLPPNAFATVMLIGVLPVGFTGEQCPLSGAITNSIPMSHDAQQGANLLLLLGIKLLPAGTGNGRSEDGRETFFNFSLQPAMPHQVR